MGCRESASIAAVPTNVLKQREPVDDPPRVRRLCTCDEQHIVDASENRQPASYRLFGVPQLAQRATAALRDSQMRHDTVVGTGIRRMCGELSLDPPVEFAR